MNFALIASTQMGDHRDLTTGEVFASYGVNTRAEQLITHGVEPKENALTCSACHSSRTQMDLRPLGYVLKGPQNQVCTQCHEQKSNPDFNPVHKKHVESEKIDCSMCHTFTRPERNLSIGITH